jgi:1-aminocyclopropane-1-carboxylate deaminase/D-cysteine desulfhydrase-like pyridoxal-dependent ACC family enzyme
MWIKRDDLNAPEMGGNKARSLEFLLGKVGTGDTVLTIGGAGSTHVLSTAIHSNRLGARTIAPRWKHDMNPTAERLAEVSTSVAHLSPILPHEVVVFAYTAWLRLTSTVHYVPLGGSVALGVLGQVNAGLELAEQIERGEMPEPAKVVLPLGSGGTVAGVALGFAIAGVKAQIIGARVAPRIAANLWRVRRLAHATAKLIERHTGEKLPRIEKGAVRVAHEMFGGAYGRPVAAADAIAQKLTAAGGPQLDSTYSAKAFAVAVEVARSTPGPTLFWLTFDPRSLTRGR